MTGLGVFVKYLEVSSVLLFGLGYCGVFGRVECSSVRDWVRLIVLWRERGRGKWGVGTLQGSVV
jgi:hypothetical protein